MWNGVDLLKDTRIPDEKLLQKTSREDIGTGHRYFLKPIYKVDKLWYLKNVWKNYSYQNFIWKHLLLITEFVGQIDYLLKLQFISTVQMLYIQKKEATGSVCHRLLVFWL